MKQASEPRTKKCPVCQKEYPEEDNYCGDDGSTLKQAEPSSGHGSLQQSGKPFDTDES